MNALLKDQSRLTDRYQTTIPSSVRKALDLKKGDDIQFLVEPNGRVYLAPIREAIPDQAVGALLQFLESDISAHPERLRAFGGGLRSRLEALVGDVDVDLDAPLSPDDE